jgi:hypothetical protein
MSVMGDWVVLDETIPDKAHYLRFDRTVSTAQDEHTFRWAKRILALEPGRFAEDARGFYYENHAEEESDQLPYENAMALAIWSPDWARRYVYAWEIAETVRAYIDPQ